MSSARLVVFGVPKGFSCSQCPKEDAFLENYYNNQKGTKMVVSRRTNGDVHYTYLVYADEGKNFTDCDGRPGAFLGMSLIFKNQYVQDPQKIENLLKETYSTYAKDQIVKELPNGNKRFLLPTLATKGDIIATYLVKGMQKILSERPDLNFTKDLLSFSPAAQSRTETR